MALIMCPQCGKEVSSTTKKCIYCEYVFDEDHVEKKSKSNKKKIVLLSILAGIILVTIGILFLTNRATSLEKNAKQYVNELENMIGDIDVVDAVSFSYISNDDEMNFYYLIEYTHNGKEDFALFIDDLDASFVGYYAGNGYNGGESNEELQMNINNINALSAQTDYFKYLLGEGDKKIITEDEAKYNHEIGIIQLDITKIN